VRALLAAAAVLLLAAVLVPPLAAAAGGAPCAAWAVARCDDAVTVPLDRADPGRGTLRIGYTRLPRTDLSRPPAGAVVVATGGPGVASDPDSYVRELAALRRDHDLVTWDYRGVGRSGWFDCPGLDLEDGSPPAALRGCAQRLGDRLDLFTTAHAAEDLDAVRAALGLERVDLVGFSYGTLVGQVYAQRHPERLRTLTLYGPLDPGRDPWDRPAAQAPLRALRETCAATRPCRDAGEDPVDTWARLVQRVRADGGPVGLTHLVDLHERDLGRDPALPAAARAHLAGDPLPLQRLAKLGPWAERPPTRAERAVAARLRAGRDDRGTSDALNYAVICHDLPGPDGEVYDRVAPVAVRRAQYLAARAALPGDAYAPFTVDEWPPSGSRKTDQCVEWDVRRPADPPIPPGAAGPPVPTLVIAGSTDARTPPEDGERVAARFPDAALLVVPFGDHSPSTRCEWRLVERFVAAGRPDAVRLDGCNGPVDPPTATFPRTLAEVPPAAGDGPELVRRLAAAAALTVADAVRQPTPQGGTAPGLRGGDLRTTESGEWRRLDLDEVRLVGDVAVNGQVDHKYGTLRAFAAVTAASVDGATVELSIETDGAGPAAVTGTAGGVPFRLSVPAGTGDG
jgi:pimeloyl-ACP methyl ester carboxylesterase